MRRLPAMLLLLIPATVLLAQAGPGERTATSQPTSRPGSIDERLVRKLLGGQSSTLDTVDSTLADMDQAATRLKEKLDPGPQTQLLQKKIVDGVDQMIEQARRNRSTGGRQSAQRSGERRPGVKRPQRTAEKSDACDPGHAAKGGLGAADDGRRDGAGARASDKAELSRGWGFLPLRDRQEVSQGFDEDFLNKYREEIIRYYRDLAKAAEREK